MIAWGTLFSLLLHQPLLAALLAIGAESLSLTFAINTFVEGNLPTISLSAYVAVLPARLAIAVSVFALDVLLARRWLALDTPRSTAKSSTAHPSSSAETTLVPAEHLVVPSFAGRAKTTRLRVLSHLLWQTWHGSWQWMFAATAIALLLCCIPYLATVGVGFRGKEQWLAFAPFAIGLVAAALYASLVFTSDQHGRSYRFLAEHAAWPRYVWTARLLMWLTPAFIVLAMGGASRYWGARSMAAVLRDIRSASPYWDQHPQDIVYFAAALNFTSWGILLGIAVGQACSLFFRRAIVAGFAAVVISIPLLIWGFALWSWELPPAVFILPLVVGLFVATWLRIPDWIVDRNSLRAWLKVAAAVAIPLVFLGWRLPIARELPVKSDRMALAQIAGAVGIKPSLTNDAGPFDVSAVVTTWVKRYGSEATDAERATGDRLIRLSELLGAPGGAATYYRRLLEFDQPNADEAMALCKEEFVFPPIHDLGHFNPTYDRLTTMVELLSQAGVAAAEQGKLDDALKFQVAALRLWNHLCDATSASYTLSTSVRLLLQSRLVDWAGAKGQTTDRIRRAMTKLDTIDPPSGMPPADDQFRIDESSLSKWTPPVPLLIEYLSLREILLGKQPSNLLTQSAGVAQYLAVMANQIPFERNRALKLWDYLMVIHTAQWQSVISHADQDFLQHVAQERAADGGAANAVDTGRLIRGQIQLAFVSSFEPLLQETVRGRDYPPYSWLRTSALLREELQQRGPFGRWLQSVVDGQVATWGLRQQLALIAYKLDHGSYPDSLDALVPNYLSFVPIDPYSGLPFEYRPHGLPLEFRGDGGADSSLASKTPLLWSVGPGDGACRSLRWWNRSIP